MLSLILYQRCTYQSSHSDISSRLCLTTATVRWWKCTWWPQHRSCTWWNNQNSTNDITIQFFTTIAYLSPTKFHILPYKLFCPPYTHNMKTVPYSMRLNVLEQHPQLELASSNPLMDALPPKHYNSNGLHNVPRAPEENLPNELDYKIPTGDTLVWKEIIIL